MFGFAIQQVFAEIISVDANRAAADTDSMAWQLTLADQGVDTADGDLEQSCNFANREHCVAGSFRHQRLPYGHVQSPAGRCRSRTP